MKNILLALFCFFSINIFAQDNYFQQEVNYKINVTLNDEEHTVSGMIEIEYTNHAPHDLDSIYFNLWGNAFKNTRTAFAEQKLRMSSTEFYFSSNKSKGFYSNLDFSVNEEKAVLIFDKKNPDIAVLRLPNAIKKGETVKIKSPFTLKIPDSFSRLGHVGTSYQMTQWYPKPAVYDHKGWHPMPYLDLGEFYSEFGNYDVTITLPENYVVGASGVLQTESEKTFLKNKIAETEKFIENGFPKNDSFPASSTSMKTIQFIAENVHDFAWFADKRFNVIKGESILASGKKVDTWAMFINKEADLWERAAEYVTRAVEFYSEMVGEYPWPQATAVHSALSAGGGMEYPMITVIGNSGSATALDDVITHEVGHNWFYGILASNEREHAWMDEGMNSYYEYRYMRRYYGRRVDIDVPKFLLNHSHEDVFEMAYLYNARRNLDQAPDMHSNEFEPVNYMIGSYVKPGTVLGHLEHYLGTAEFDRIMHVYYEKWQFRHPYPEDFQQLVEQESGKDLAWFFDGYIFSNKKLDYSLLATTTDGGGFNISIKNKGEIAAPFPVSGLKNGEVVQIEWFEGFDGEKEFSFPSGDYDQLILDAENVTLDFNRKNNNLKTQGMLKSVEPLRVGLMGVTENSRRNTVNVWPLVGYNKYDGAMLGLALHNGLLPTKKLEWQLATMYGFDSKDPAGFGSIRYNVFPVSEKIKKITFGLSSKAFNYRALDSLKAESGNQSTHLRYSRIVPSIKVELRRSPTSKFYQIIQLRSVMGVEERTDFEPVDTLGTFYVGNSNHGRIINELSWEMGDKRVLNPYSLKVTFEQSSFEDFFDPTIDRSYIRANLEWKSSYTFDHKRSFDLRVFIGGFLKNDYSERGFISNGAYNLTGQGFNDYRWDELYFGRTETSGLLSRQVTQREGGMKVALGSPHSEGRSNSFIFAINLKSDLPQDLPGKLPLKPYFDLGYYKDNRPISTNDPNFDKSKQLWFQGGFTLELLDGGFGVHFPAVNSEHVKDLLNQSGQDTFFKRISFTLDLFKLNPWDLVNDVQL